jgi:hypothetical protein
MNVSLCVRTIHHTHGSVENGEASCESINLLQQISLNACKGKVVCVPGRGGWNGGSRRFVVLSRR